MLACFRVKSTGLRGKNAGDTIIEVLIAITVAAFAIGTSYAIANKSLQKAITARERNEALNIIENQISALKIRYKANASDFRNPTNGFVVSSSDSTVGTKFHFCLEEQSSGPSDTVRPWPRQLNNFTSDTQPNTLSVGNPGYNARCIRTTSTASYYIDISAQVTSASANATNKTVYKLMVRWPQVGSGTANSSTIYYRL